MSTKALRPGTALLILLGLAATMGLGVGVFDVNIHGLLVLVTASVAAIAKLHGIAWQDVRTTVLKAVGDSMGALLLFPLIGILTATWAQSGTLAALVAYGLEWVSAPFFLPTAMILCALMSMATGSAWGTVATAGTALLGVGTTLGMGVGPVAGVIVAGATFGDKMSPVSDTTNLAAMAAGTDVGDHVRGMMPTGLISFAIALLIAAGLGIGCPPEAPDTSQIDALIGGLRASFHIGPHLLIPPALVIGLSVRRVAPELALLAGAASAAVLGMLFQGVAPHAVLGAAGAGFKADTGVALLDTLLSRGGIQSMMWTFSLAVLALCLGGVLDRLGVLQTATRGVFQRLTRARHLLPATIVVSAIGTAAMAEAYLSILLNGKTLAPAFRAGGHPPRVLSRCLEQGATLSTGLLPWTTAGAYYAGVLGVSASVYAPFAFFNLVEIGLGLSVALFARDVTKRTQPQE